MDPNTEEARARALAEGSQVLTDVSQEDLRDNAALMTNTTTSLHARFESASNTDAIAADEYRRLLRELYRLSNRPDIVGTVPI